MLICVSEERNDTLSDENKGVVVFAEEYAFAGICRPMDDCSPDFSCRPD